MVETEEKTKLTCWQKTDRQCRAFANFFYNKQTGEVMARSRSSWGKIGLFYLIYYGFLAGFFSACLTIFLSTLNEPGKGGPKTTQFLRGDSAPGLNIVSDFKGWKTAEKTVIANRQKWIQAYLNRFNDPGYGEPCVPGVRPSGDKPCKFNQTLLGNCSGDIPGQDFGHSTMKLCTFVKINKVYGWIPDAKNGDYLKLKCWADGAKVTVVPEGYLISAFPFRGEKFYQTPPVAVIVEAAGKTFVHCRLEGEGITTSESFVANRAFGKIKYEVSP